MLTGVAWGTSAACTAADAIEVAADAVEVVVGDSASSPHTLVVMIIALASSEHRAASSQQHVRAVQQSVRVSHAGVEHYRQHIRHEELDQRADLVVRGVDEQRQRHELVQRELALYSATAVTIMCAHLPVKSMMLATVRIIQYYLRIIQ